MQLTQSDIINFARQIAEFYQQPKSEKVAVKGTPVKKIIREKRIVEKPVVKKVEEKKSGYQSWLTLLGLVLAVILWIALNNVILFFLIGIPSILGFFLIKMKMQKIIIREETVMEDVEEFFNREIEEDTITYEERIIPNSKRVKAIGRVALDFLAISIENGTLLMEPYGSFESKELIFPELSEPSLFYKIIEELEEKTSKIPYILQGEASEYPVQQGTVFNGHVILRGLEKEIYEGYQRLDQVFKNVNNTKFKIQAVSPKNELWQFINPKSLDGQMTPALECGKKLSEKLDSREGRELDRLVENALLSFSIKHLAINGVRFVSLHNGIAPVCHNLGLISHYSAFNFYCPYCNSDTQENLLNKNYLVQSDLTLDFNENKVVSYSQNTRCIYDPDNEIWYCPTCEKAINNPIPVHKMLDEVLIPAYDRLMEENKNERIRIYSDTRNRELEYINDMNNRVEETFQRHRDTMELFLDEIAKLDAEVLGEEQAINSLRNVMQDYKLQQSQALSRVSAKAQEIVALIEKDRKNAISNIDETFERERKEMITFMQECSRTKRIEDEKRDEIFRNMAYNMQRTADASEESSRRLGNIDISTRRTADASEESSRRLGNIDISTRRTADASEESSRHLGNIDISTRRTADVTKGIEAAAGDFIKQQKEQMKELKHGNYLQAAMAEKQGVERRPAWYDIIGHLNMFTSNLLSNILDEDDYKRAKRKEKVLR